ncbi:hypothetical protein A0J61_03617 [Choanephora cucurbitarum]|uniref:F-box domain-containing protein n=1 Tax=Choanephora cucurbitarum TaxID=101091 RepID=A0A1C7NH08_9FUNG|nr:hypothetical protein A0J61_03617 [Choanephora cucurbitarum]
MFFLQADLSHNRSLSFITGLKVFLPYSVPPNNFIQLLSKLYPELQGLMMSTRVLEKLSMDMLLDFSLYLNALYLCNYMPYAQDEHMPTVALHSLKMILFPQCTVSGSLSNYLIIRCPQLETMILQLKNDKTQILSIHLPY